MTLCQTILQNSDRWVVFWLVTAGRVWFGDWPVQCTRVGGHAGTRCGVLLAAADLGVRRSGAHAAEVAVREAVREGKIVVHTKLTRQ